MATIEGARSLGLEDREIGSHRRRQVGGPHRASTSPTIETQPCFDPASHVVYAAGREHVTHVWVAGRARLLERRKLQGPGRRGPARQGGLVAA